MPLIHPMELPVKRPFFAAPSFRPGKSIISIVAPVVFLGLYISLRLCSRSSSTATTATFGSAVASEYVLTFASIFVRALKIVVLPELGKPMIPIFIRCVFLLIYASAKGVNHTGLSLRCQGIKLLMTDEIIISLE